MDHQSGQVTNCLKDDVDSDSTVGCLPKLSSTEQRHAWLSQLTVRHQTLAGKIEKQKRLLATIHDHILYFDSSDPSWLEKISPLKVSFLISNLTILKMTTKISPKVRP